ncbi:MAG: sigma factor-like helix-turn-helix DNA-binding protein [Bacillota bacterium]
MGYEEIAEVLGISLGAVKTRIHRARKAFRDKMVGCSCSLVVEGGACKCEGVPAT